MIDFIVRTIVYSGIGFLRRWYVERTLWFWSRISDLIHALDRKLAVFINAKLFFTPLYGDYSVTGRILGPLFRVWRVLFGSLFYAAVVMGAAALWLGYCLLLPYLVFAIVT